MLVPERIVRTTADTVVDETWTVANTEDVLLSDQDVRETHHIACKRLSAFQVLLITFTLYRGWF